jgi:hypothetical protein
MVISVKCYAEKSRFHLFVPSYNNVFNVTTEENFPQLNLVNVRLNNTTYDR